MTPLLGRKKLLDSGLTQQALEFVKRNTRVTAKLEGGAGRTQRWTYTEEVVREVLVNALVHRGYLLSSTDIEILIYEDRLEVTSPCRLPNGITPEKSVGTTDGRG